MAPQPVVLCTLLAATALAAREWTSGEEGLARGGDTFLDNGWGPRHGDWGYGGANGPETWPSTFPECGGDAQSPVDIKLSAVGQLNCPSPLVVPNFAWDKAQLKILNNGHSVQLEPVDPASVQDRLLTGGPLAGEYQLLQIHFHWGDTNAKGSEHAVDGSYYAMEMHMVFARKTCRHWESYRTHGDFAVIGVFLQLANKPNPSLEPVVSHLPNVVQLNSQTLSCKRFSTTRLVPPASSGVLVYNGSLTTPPCSEIVTWLVFKRPVIVSPKQVAQFRKLKSPSGPLTINRRPVQPMNGRPVYWACAQPTIRGLSEPLFTRAGAAWPTCFALLFVWAPYS